VIEDVLHGLQQTVIHRMLAFVLDADILHTSFNFRPI